MANEMKPCPFCGSAAKESGSNAVGITIECSNADCKGSPFVNERNRAEAYPAWNRRTPSPAFVAMKDALREILEHVEDMQIARVGSQCTLCHTFRKLGHAALALAQKEAAE